MNVMTLDEIASLVDEMESKSAEKIVSEHPFGASLIRTLAANSELAVSTITAKISEEKYAKMRSIIHATTLFVCMTSGKGLSLLLAETEQELITFTDSVTMAIIGTLIDNDIL